MKLPEKNWVEWIVFSISLVLVGGTMAFLAYDAATSGVGGPDILVRLGSVEENPTGVKLPVLVINRGSRTAEDVHVEVVWPLAEGGSQQGEIEIMHLPRHSTREGWVTFSGRLRSGQKPFARVIGYRQP